MISAIQLESPLLDLSERQAGLEGSGRFSRSGRTRGFKEYENSPANIMSKSLGSVSDGIDKEELALSIRALPRRW